MSTMIEKVLLEEGYLERVISGAIGTALQVNGGTITRSNRSIITSGATGNIRAILKQHISNNSIGDENQVVNLDRIYELEKEVAQLKKRNESLQKTVDHWRTISEPT